LILLVLMEPEQRINVENKNLSAQPTKLKTYSENSGCFGFSKLMTIACKPLAKQDQLQKLLHSSRYSQLEKLFYEHEQRSNKRQMANVLVQILQIQEVKSIQEYTINGITFKVHVVEDTEL